VTIYGLGAAFEAGLRADRARALARTMSGSRGSSGRISASARTLRRLGRSTRIWFIATSQERACPESAPRPM